MSTTPDQRPVGPIPWTPGAGLARLRDEWGKRRIPKITSEVDARTDEILAEAARMIAARSAG